MKNSIMKTPKQSLNKAYLGMKPERNNIEIFKKNLIRLLNSVDEIEREENQKNHIRDFLRDTFYRDTNEINTKDTIDLAIHLGSSNKDKVGVIIEAKRPSNKIEMITKENLNVKSLQELVLYYLRERIINNNLEIKNLIITNVYEWYIFDSILFEKNFAQNKELVKLFIDFEEKRLSGKDTSFFYTEIAYKFIEENIDNLQYTYFHINDYEVALRNTDNKDDTILISLYKLLSPEHLLKLPFSNDSNTLDKNFYGELLHIIGLSETKQGTKKLITRKKENERNAGSLLESTIFQLDDIKDIEEQFNISLELVLTWINRIIFLKLLEGQQLKYQKGNKDYEYLRSDKIGGFDELNNLFFKVLAVKNEERHELVKEKFKFVPYLNSSLFEKTEIETKYFPISQLTDGEINIYSSTILKDTSGRKKTGKINTLKYLFCFASLKRDASEGSEEIQEENKTLINASVLGLIFEKINGYKDGSFFTPGYITMYMSRETIRRTIVQKFNDTKGWDVNSIIDLYNKIDDINEANKIINSLKICDPAVGSGHFLVSALNEIIAVKSELNILLDNSGKRLKEYNIIVENDELIITDEDANLFSYNPKNKESQRVQTAIFSEKQLIIENCLFGVDINPNSVKICRLRLWIELLKNTYYTESSSFSQLETLPNIDINIKCGNSLISRFDIDVDIKEELKKIKYSVQNYKEAVFNYKNALGKEKKHEMESIIIDLKEKFKKEIEQNIKKKKELNNLKNQLIAFNQGDLFGLTKAEINEKNKKIDDINSKITKLEIEIEELKNHKIYENSFEWRFEFPEVLNNTGDFIGFDAVIGNPPYGVSIKGKERDILINKIGKVPDFEIYYFFIEMSRMILKENGQFAFIIPNSIMFNVYAQQYRISMFDKWTFEEILDCTELNIFYDATVRNILLFLKKELNGQNIPFRNTLGASDFNELINRPKILLNKEIFINNNQNWSLILKLPKKILNVIIKIKTNSDPLSKYFPETSQGLIAYDKYTGQSEDIIENRVYHSFEEKENYKYWLYGEDVTKYRVRWNGKEYINYCSGIANPRDPKYFIGKRILIREITNPSIYAALTDEEFYNDPAIIIIKDNKSSPISIETLLGILNSKLATFYHFNSSPKASKGAFPKILVYDTNNFPIPKDIDSQIEIKINSIVKSIIGNINCFASLKREFLPVELSG